jgi:hypothetical protein
MVSSVSRPARPTYGLPDALSHGARTLDPATSRRGWPAFDESDRLASALADLSQECETIVDVAIMLQLAVDEEDDGPRERNEHGMNSGAARQAPGGICRRLRARWAQ